MALSETLNGNATIWMVLIWLNNLGYIHKANLGFNAILSQTINEQKGYDSAVLTLLRNKLV